MRRFLAAERSFGRRRGRRALQCPSPRFFRRGEILAVQKEIDTKRWACCWPSGRVKGVPRASDGAHLNQAIAIAVRIGKLKFQVICLCLQADKGDISSATGRGAIGTREKKPGEWLWA